MKTSFLEALHEADELIKEAHKERRINGAILAANKLISEACLAEYTAANHSKTGKKYAKHRPYSVPEWCKNLQKIILTRDEAAIKAAMNAARSGCFSEV